MVTIPQLAKVTGFCTYTVSCSLRGVGVVAPKTRQLILDAAARLGYQPNSAASMLAGRRHRKVSEPLQVPVAMVGAMGDGAISHFLAACAARGLDGRVLVLHDGKRVAREIDALWEAGVKGLYLKPVPLTAPALGQVDLSRFCVVKHSRAYPALRFHLVRHSAFDYMMETVRRVFGAGYRRVAVVLTCSLSEDDDMARVGAVEAFRRLRMARGASLRLFHTATQAGDAGTPGIVARVLGYHPDAIIAFPFSWFYEFRLAGVQIPGEVGFAAVMAHRGLANTPEISGCDTADVTLCGRAVATLYGLFQAGERGFASEPVESVVEPVWLEGETLVSSTGCA